jgi:hypothetical protein
MYNIDDIKVIHSSKIYELLFAIERKSHIWISSKSITALENFIAGYLTLAGNDNDIYYPDEPHYNEFIYWIYIKNKKQNRFSFRSFPLTKLLLSKNRLDEEKAFEMYFDELREFIIERKSHIKPL